MFTGYSETVNSSSLQQIKGTIGNRLGLRKSPNPEIKKHTYQLKHVLKVTKIA